MIADLPTDEISPAAQPLSGDELALLNAYWRATNYISIGQIYLLGNPLLKEPLKPDNRRNS